jgi:hypothetical protein
MVIPPIRSFAKISNCIVTDDWQLRNTDIRQKEISHVPNCKNGLIFAWRKGIIYLERIEKF